MAGGRGSTGGFSQRFRPKQRSASEAGSVRCGTGPSRSEAGAVTAISVPQTVIDPALVPDTVQGAAAGREQRLSVLAATQAAVPRRCPLRRGVQAAQREARLAAELDVKKCKKVLKLENFLDLRGSERLDWNGRWKAGRSRSNIS